MVYKFCSWLSRKLSGPDDDPCGSSVRRIVDEMRLAQCNDAEIISRDPHPEPMHNEWRRQATDPEAALPELVSLAERGSVWSMFLVGSAYESGKGAAADAAQAERWYRMACEAGCQQAQLRLGRMYYVRQDFVRCAQVFESDARDRWAPAMYFVACTILQQPRTRVKLDEARFLLQEAAKLGDVGAEVDLARLMLKGCFGLWSAVRGTRVGFIAACKIIRMVEAKNNTQPPVPLFGG